MKLTFLGTSHGVPECNRRCSCTMIETSGNYYFVDMGMMAIDELINRGISVDAVKGVFVTHLHGDHVNGLLSFLDLLSWKFKTANPRILLPDAAGIDPICAWLEVIETNSSGAIRDSIDLSAFTEGVIFDDGTLKVTAVATQHIRGGEKPSFAFFLEAEGKKVLFTGDLRGPDVDFPACDPTHPLDLAVLEGAHFPVLNYKPFIDQGIAKRYCFNHYVQSNYGNIIQLKKEYGAGRITMTTDGLELTV